MPPAPRDELPHRAPAGAGADWCERWSFGFATADAHLAGWISYSRFAGHAWYEAVLTGAHRPIAVVLDHEVPFRSSPFEVRTTGLWADHVCEAPLDHWTLGLEAFALGVDDPLELLGRQLGDQVPLGFDLEWEADAPATDDPVVPGTGGYAQPCRVHGEVLVGATAIELDAVGHRRHRWGDLEADLDRWTLDGVVEGGERWTVDGHAGRARALVADGDVGDDLPWAAELTRDHAGLPDGVVVRAAGGDLRAEVLTAVPLPVPDRPTLRTVALCRLRTADGRTGVGWLGAAGGRRAVGA